jgi:hypothetical protein
MTPRRSLTVIGVLTLALMTPSCGDNGDPRSTAESDSERHPQEACAPMPADPADQAGEAISEGASTELELPESSASIEILRSARRLSIAGHFDQDHPFQAPENVVFVAVTYRMENHGPMVLEPSRAVNRAALVRDETGRTWEIADTPQTCGPISASLTKVHGISNPENEVASGDAVTTAVVFSVPSQADGLEFLLPDHNLAVRLRPAA